MLLYKKVPKLRQQRFCSDIEPHHLVLTERRFWVLVLAVIYWLVNHMYNVLVLGEMFSEIIGLFQKQLVY
jgi:hypothetical protein